VTSLRSTDDGALGRRRRFGDRGRALCTAVVALALAAFPWTARAAIALEVSVVANLAYHLDCVSDAVVSCGARTAFRELWKDRFGVDTESDTRIRDWREVRERHRGTIGGRPGQHAQFDLEQRVRRTSFSAHSFDEYYRYVALLISPDDTRRVMAIVESFRPAFEAWWGDTAVDSLTRKVQALRDVLATPDLRNEIRRIEAFYGASPAPQPMVVQGIYRPAVNGGNTTAQLIGEDAVAEIPANDLVELRVPVLVHEYAHLLLSRLSATQASSLRQAVVNAGGATGRGAWLLFDEAVATSLGNGRVARSMVSDQAWKQQLGREQSLYNEGAIDAAAKAILPLVDTFIEQGRAITDPGFAKEYASVVARSLGPRLRTPAVVFSELATVSDVTLGPDLAKAVGKAIIDATGNISMWHWRHPCCGADFLKPFADHPDKTHLIVVSSRRLQAATFVPASVRKALMRLPIPSYAIATRNASTLVVIVASSADDAAAAMRAMFAKDVLADGSYAVGSR
jgi:hypothetical protein